MVDEEKSISWIVTALMVVIALFGWGFLAGSYAGANGEDVLTIPMGDRYSAVVPFIYTAVVQLPNLVTVITWHLSNRTGYPSQSSF